MSKNYNIVLLPGDGIGPEVTEQAVKVCNAIGEKYDHQFNWEKGLIGAVAINTTGNPYPDETHETCLNADAILAFSWRPKILGPATRGKVSI